MDSPGGPSGKEHSYQCRKPKRRSSPGSRRSPGGGNGNPLQSSCLENPMHRGAWWATAHGVAEWDTTEHAWLPIPENRVKVLPAQGLHHPSPTPLSYQCPWILGSNLPFSFIPGTPVSGPLHLLLQLPGYTPACPSVPAGLCSNVPTQLPSPAHAQIRLPFHLLCPIHAGTFSQLPGG